MKIVTDGPALGKKLKQNMDKAAAQVKQAIRGAADDAAEAIEQRGRADIAAGGRFGSTWQDAFRAEVSDEASKVRIDVMMDGEPPVSYWKIFEYGATISANNPSGLMWIPFDRDNKTWPRDYPGGLFRIGNALFDRQTREPMYAGTPQVTIPQKFHLRDIIKEVAQELSKFYSVNLLRK